MLADKETYSTLYSFKFDEPREPLAEENQP